TVCAIFFSGVPQYSDSHIEQSHLRSGRTAKRLRRQVRTASKDSVLLAGYRVQRSDLLGICTAALHSCLEVRIVELSVSNVPYLVKALLLAIRKVLPKPRLKECGHTIRQSQHDIASKASSRSGGGFNDSGQLVIGESGNNRGNQNASRHTRLG